MRRLTLPALLALACAQPGAPPGAPDEREPPELVRVSPESGSVSVRPREVRFEFDEVVSERPQGGAVDLAGLVIISPRDGAPRVGWHRKAISVRPRREWRENTAYTVILRPGLADLRGNVRPEPASTIFSTGPSIPPGRIAGIVFDWVNARPAAGAIVEARIPPDSLVPFVGVADSTGRVHLGHLEPATYVVHGYVDANNNLGRDPREPYDSALVALGDSARIELYVFVHDTIAPRVEDVVVRDSVTLEATLDRPMDPTQPLDTSLVRLRAADSTAIPIVAVLRAEEWLRMQDSVARAREDSVRRAEPGTQVPLPPRRAQPAAVRDTVVMQRPRPILAIVLRTARPLEPASQYRLDLRGARGLLGVTDTTSRVFSTPVRRPATDTTSGRP